MWRFLPALCLVAACGAGAPSARGPGGVPLSYRVGALREYATLYLPAPAVAGPAPVVVLLHGGFFGDDATTAALGRRLAGQGVIAAVPSFRGERRRLDGERSEGRIEFCAGEVEDALVLLRRLRRRPDVDPRRIALLGFSHGGCIALRAAARDPQLRAVATFSAPADAAAAYKNLSDRPLRGLLFNGFLASRLRSFVGAGPQRAAARWADRSPLREAGLITAPLLLIHGVTDDVIPVDHACKLAEVLARSGRPWRERLFDRQGAPVAQPRPVCPAAAGAEAAGLPVELWLYAGQSHTFGKAAKQAAEARALTFLLGELKE